MSENERQVRAEDHGAVRVVILSRVAKRNAMTPAMLRELRHEIDRARCDAGPTATGVAAREGTSGGVRALVVGGDGAVFSSGFDLKLVNANPSVLTELIAELAGVIEALITLDVPVIVAAQGAAVAGACAMLSAGDLVLSDPGAVIGYPVVSLGISPAVSGPTLRMRVTDGKARELLLNPVTVDGEHARRTGLVSKLCDWPEDVLPSAVRLAKQLAEKPPHAMAATKAWLREVESLGDWPARGRDTSLSLCGSNEQVTRVAARFGPGG